MPNLTISSNGRPTAGVARFRVPLSKHVSHLSALKMNHVTWHEVNRPHWSKWEKVFDIENLSSPLSASCPICSAANLSRWYRLDDPGERVIGKHTFAGRGFTWQWCSACGAYRFLSCQVLKGWLAVADQTPPPVELYDLSKPFTEFSG